MASPLSAYFLSPEYVQGQEFPFQDHGYSLVQSSDPAFQDVYEHEVSKIRVWSFALDARSVREGGCVAYHYTNEMFFKLITHASKENIELFASKKKNEDSSHGLGLYAASKAPDQWTCQDEALINNFWPRPATWDKWRETQGLPPALRPEGNSARELLETELLDYVRTVEGPQQLHGKAAYCIPVLCDAADAINVMTDATPVEKLPGGSNDRTLGEIWHKPVTVSSWHQNREPGFNRFGEKEADWRDVCVIALLGDRQVTNLVQSSDATIQQMRQRVEVKRETFGDQHRKTLLSMSKLASLLWVHGKMEEAESMYRGVLKGRKDTLGTPHPATVSSMNNLATVLQARGKLEEAEQLHREALNTHKESLGVQHPHTLGSMQNLAGVLKARGSLEEAEQLYQDAVKATKEALGATHPQTLSCMSGLAVVLQSRGSWREAEELHRDVLKAQKETLGAQHLQTLHSMSSLAVVLQSRGCLEEAEQCLREVLKARKHTLGSQHPKTLSSMHKLGILLHKLGRSDEAAETFRQASDGRTAVLGASHPDTRSSIEWLAVVMRVPGKTVEAMELEPPTPCGDFVMPPTLE